MSRDALLEKRLGPWRDEASGHRDVSELHRDVRLLAKGLDDGVEGVRRQHGSLIRIGIGDGFGAGNLLRH